MQTTKIPLTRGLFTIVNVHRFESLSQHKWYALKAEYNFYAARDVKVNGQRKRIYMHREITNCPKGKEVHHDNRDSLDNTDNNLIVCTKKVNLSKRVYANRQVHLP